MGKCTTGIIFVLVTALCPFLELRNYQVIASGTFTERTHMIVNFFSSIDTHNHVAHLFVTEFHHFIIYQNTVGGQCKTEVFIMYLFLLSSVSYQVFDNLPVHQRFPSEEVYFQISSASGISDQEIQCFLSYFVGHQCTSSMVFSLFRKAVLTGQVTVMRDMQTQRFDYRWPLFKMLDRIFINVLGKQHSLIGQLLNLFESRLQVFFGIRSRQFFCHFSLRTSLIQQGDTVIYNIIHHMNRSAVYIKNNCVSITFILMNHFLFSFFFSQSAVFIRCTTNKKQAAAF